MSLRFNYLKYSHFVFQAISVVIIFKKWIGIRITFFLVKMSMTYRQTDRQSRVTNTQTQITHNHTDTHSTYILAWNSWRLILHNLDKLTELIICMDGKKISRDIKANSFDNANLDYCSECDN